MIGMVEWAVWDGCGWTWVCGLMCLALSSTGDGLMSGMDRDQSSRVGD